MNKNTLGIALVAAMLPFPVAHAASNDLLDESAFFVDIPEVTSATRMPQKLTDAPASITIIDRDMIDASGAQTIPDLLRLVPGFQSFLVNSNKPATTYHGASDNWPKRLEVMIDGRSVYLPLLSTVDWISLGLNIEDIDRIEVVRGSNVPTQGSNAFLGSINIITRQPAASDGSTISTTAGSMGTANAYASYANVPGTISYRISGAHEGNDGRRHLNTLYADTTGNEYWNDDLSKNYFNLNLAYTPSLNDTWLFNFGAGQGYNTAGQLDHTNKPYDRREHRTNYESVQFNRLLSDTDTLQIRAYHNYVNLSSPLASVAFAQDALQNAIKQRYGVSIPIPADIASETIALSHFRPLNEHGSTHTYDAEVQLSGHRSKLDMVGGMGFRHESATSDMLLQQGTASEDRYRLFGNLGYKITPRWKFNSGLMYEHGAANSDAFSYRHALNFKLNVDSSIRLGYSSSERLPSLLERHSYNNVIVPPIPGVTSGTLIWPQWRNDPNIQPEQNKTLELGFYKTLQEQRGYLDARLFHEKISDAILTYEDAYKTYANIGQWTNDGLETQLKFRPQTNFWYLFTYSYINTRPTHWIKKGGTPIQWSAPITPRNTASVLVDWQPTPTLNLSATQYYMSQTQWFEGDVRKAYRRTDLRAEKTWHLNVGTDLKVALIVQNAFGPTYSEFYRDNRFDRRTFLQATLHFR